MPDNSSRPLLAVGLRCLGTALVATMFMLAKLLGQRGVAVTESIFWLLFITVPALIAWLGSRGQLQRLATTRIKGYLARTAVGLASTAFGFVAAKLLHLAEFTTLTFTAPLFAVVIAAVILREHVGPWRWGAVICGFLGVLVIARPDGAPISLVGAACGLLSGLTTGVVSFQIRDLATTEQPINAVFWYAALGSLAMAVFLPFVAHRHDAGTWALLLLLGLVGLCGQLLLVAALRFGPVSSVIIMDTTQLLWAALYGRFIWNELPSPTLWLGAPMVILAAVVIAWREHRLSRLAAGAARAGFPAAPPAPGGG